MSQINSISRRQVLKSAAIAAATIVPRSVLGGPGHVPPSDRVNVALVGAGGRGLQNARELMKLADVRVTAIADPAERWDLSNFYYRGVAGRTPVAAELDKHYQAVDPRFRCRQHLDYRRMIDESADEFDAVLCATPDHLHALVTLAALRNGKHVYCEKPLTHNIAEARLVAKVASDSGLATQMGNQGHSRDTMRLTIELLRSGAVGEIKEVHAWVPATRWNPALVSPPTTSQPLPAGLDWDLWCGPRQPPQFHSAYAPVSWRDFWSFGCGAMGDFGCHDLDSAVWGLELDLPRRIEMRPAGQTDPAMAPFGEIGYFDFDHGSQTELRITWYSGGLRPPTPEVLPAGEQLPARGVLFVGSQGVLVCGGAGGQPDIYPESRRDSFAVPEPFLPRSAGHHRDWIDAIKGGPPASSEFSYAAKLTEITLLGLVALRSGEPIDWDAAAMRAVGVPQADEMISGTYRRGWELQARS